MENPIHFYSFYKLPTKNSWVYEDYQHHWDQTIDEEVEVSQINLSLTKISIKVVYLYSKSLPWHKWSSDETMLGQFPEFEYFIMLDLKLEYILWVIYILSL